MRNHPEWKRYSVDAQFNFELQSAIRFECARNQCVRHLNPQFMLNSFQRKMRKNPKWKRYHVHV